MIYLQTASAPVYALAFSPHNNGLVSGTKNGVIQVWGDDGPSTIYSPEDNQDPSGAVQCLEFSPDGQYLRAGCENHFLEFPALEGWVKCKKYRTPQAITSFRYLSPTMLAVGKGIRYRESPGSLELWELPSQRPLPPRKTSTGGVRAVSVLLGKKVVAWAEWNRRITVWPITQGDAETFPLDQSASSIALRPDGEQLAAALGWNIRLIALGTRLAPLTLKGHKGTITTVAYSPDGTKLVSGSWDGTVRFWDQVTGHELACYTWPIGKATHLTFSPDGLRLAVGGDTGAITIFDVE
ncbi:MAG: WD40 repeat domain-containing protein [Fimbriiglobus sp.]